MAKITLDDVQSGYLTSTRLCHIAFLANLGKADRFR